MGLDEEFIAFRFGAAARFPADSQSRKNSLPRARACSMIRATLGWHRVSPIKRVAAPGFACTNDEVIREVDGEATGGGLAARRTRWRKYH